MPPSAELIAALRDAYHRGTRSASICIDRRPSTLVLMYLPLPLDAMDLLMPALLVVATVVQFRAGLLGRWMDARTRSAPLPCCGALMGLRPTTARGLRDGTEVEVRVQLATGDLIRVRPGEKVPVDGIVTDGTTAVDESMPPARE